MHSNKFNKLIKKWRNNPGTHVYHTFSQQLITELNSTQLKTKRMWETCNLTLKYIVKKKFLKFKEEGMCLLKFLLHSFQILPMQPHWSTSPDSKHILQRIRSERRRKERNSSFHIFRSFSLQETNIKIFINFST